MTFWSVSLTFTMKQDKARLNFCLLLTCILDSSTPATLSLMRARFCY